MTADDGAVHLASAIADQAHAGQLDKAGLPYIDHPRRVAAAVAHLGREAEAVAWLHDVVEDSGYTLTDLDVAGVPAELLASVDLLTRRRTVPPAAYYAAIRRDPVALAVKMADVADNSDPARLARLDPATRSRLERKYAEAHALLAGG